MPQPTASDVHVNRPLTSYSTAFIQDQSDFIAGQIFPSIPSESKSDEYWIYDRGDWMRNVAEKRAAGAASAGGGFTISTATFAVERYAIHQDVDDLALTLDLAAGQDHNAPAGRGPVALVDLRPHDEVGHAGLVLDSHEDDPRCGPRPLPHQDHTAHRDPGPMGPLVGIQQLDGRDRAAFGEVGSDERDGVGLEREARGGVVLHDFARIRDPRK